VPPLTEDMILAWCDAHHKSTGQWPPAKSGRIADTNEKWANINQALRMGLRNLPGGSSLARLLAQHRGVRNRKALAGGCAAGRRSHSSWPGTGASACNVGDQT